MFNINGIVILAGVLLSGFQLKAQKIDVKGSWSVESSDNDIEAGNDVVSTQTSDYDELEISVNGNVNKSSWKIQVKKDDVYWNGNLEIWLKRTGNGNGSGECWGGTSFQQVSNVGMDFINGKRVLSKIPIQVQIRGLSVLIPADDYTTDLVFTLYEF